MSSLTSPLVNFQTDGVLSETSDAQLATEALICGLIKLHKKAVDFSGLPPPLTKQAHVQYLAKNLFGLPAPFISLDASRPWMVYWILHSFDILGIALDDVTKQRGITTILSCQHPSGGFGGNTFHIPHLLPTYASVCSLAMLGGGWDQIDRKGIYAFFMRMKRPNGGFTVCEGGEVDVRGVYCLLVAATLLNLLTPELVYKTDEFIASCQTFEGGFSASSSSISPAFSSPFLPSSPNPPTTFSATPLGEAHGGYTSCAILSLHLLRSFQPSSPSSVDWKSLTRWSVMMQASAADGGGFKGRNNKLVDGCYGWWVGGSFGVLEEELKGEKGERVDGKGLYDRVALQEYILLLAQHSKGGLADKPPKKADFYHTANNLSGLSSAQHKLVLFPNKMDSLRSAWVPAASPGSQDAEERRKEVFVRTLGWTELEGEFLVLGGEANRVNTTHPSINILLLRVEPFMRHFYAQPTPTTA